MGNPAVDERQVCAVAYQGRVACFDRRNGELLWARDTSSNTGLAMDERNVYVTDDKDAVTAYDKTSGRAGWRQDKLARRAVTAPLALGAWVVVADGGDTSMCCRARMAASWRVRKSTAASIRRQSISGRVSRWRRPKAMSSRSGSSKQHDASALTRQQG